MLVSLAWLAAPAAGGCLLFITIWGRSRMSQDKEKFNFLGAWFQYEQYRKQLEQIVKDVEFSSFNLQFGAKTEESFRKKLEEARRLIDKIVELFNSGPTVWKTQVT
jgi:exonuclease VII small subunit